MLERKIIDLSAKPMFGRYIQNEENSTYNFTNMFMWEGNGAITYSEVEDCLVLLFQGGKHPVSASYPVGNGNKAEAIRQVATYITSQELRPVFRNLSETMVAELESLFPGCFTFVEDRNASDYIYETESMISMAGKALHAKRNHFNYFKNHYVYSYERLTGEHMPQCLSLYERWVEEKGEGRWMDGSREASYRLLNHFEELDIKAGGIFVDGELIAFSVGEAISDKTALIHLEFAADIRGAFNAMNREFCLHEWSDFPYVNREEDMGLPGLRKAKLAYRPCRLLQKYNAVLVKPL